MLNSFQYYLAPTKELGMFEASDPAYFPLFPFKINSGTRNRRHIQVTQDWEIFNCQPAWFIPWKY